MPGKAAIAGKGADRNRTGVRGFAGTGMGPLPALERAFRVAETAAFVASDRAGAMTARVINFKRRQHRRLIGRTLA